MASSASLYEVLGIAMDASCHEIKSAYRKLARTYHPDVVAMNQKGNSANEFMKIHSAYSTLSDPGKRAQYDREICRHRRSIEITMSAYHQRYPQAAHKWETDQCCASDCLEKHDVKGELANDTYHPTPMAYARPSLLSDCETYPTQFFNGVNVKLKWIISAFIG